MKTWRQGRAGAILADPSPGMIKKPGHLVFLFPHFLSKLAVSIYRKDLKTGFVIFLSGANSFYKTSKHCLVWCWDEGCFFFFSSPFKLQKKKKRFDLASCHLEAATGPTGVEKTTNKKKYTDPLFRRHWSLATINELIAFLMFKK